MKRALSALAIVMLALLGFATPAAAGGDSDPTVDLDGLSAEARMAVASSPCGSSYRHIGHYAIGSPAQAYMDVYWSSSAKRNCMVTNHAAPTYGVRLYTEAQIWNSTDGRPPPCPRSVGCDGEFYRYYAGPVYTPAGTDMTHRCIGIKGWIAGQSRTMVNIHCG